MDAEGLPLNYCCEREVIKGIVEVVPNVVITIFLGYFIVKTVNIRDVARFMVSPQQHDHLGVLELVQK